MSRWAVIACTAWLAHGCTYEGSRCTEYDYFSGSQPTHIELAAATGDQFVVSWRVLHDGPIYIAHTLRLDGAGFPIDGTEQEHGTETVRLTCATTDRELYRRNDDDAQLDLRRPDGTLVTTMDGSSVGACATTEGDVFVLHNINQIRRMSADGTLAAPITVARPEGSYLEGGYTTAGVTWLVYYLNDTVDVVRVTRGGAPLDSTARRITDRALHKVIAAGDRTLVALTAARDDTLTWHVINEDGTHTMTPVEIPGYPAANRVLHLIQETNSYLAVFEHVDRYDDMLGVRLSPAGQVVESFTWPEPWRAYPRPARGMTTTVLAYESRSTIAEAMTLDTVAVPFGGAPEPPTTVVEYDGEVLHHDCAPCSAGRPTSLAPVLLALLLIGRRRARPRSSPAPSRSMH